MLIRGSWGRLRGMRVFDMSFLVQMEVRWSDRNPWSVYVRLHMYVVRLHEEFSADSVAFLPFVVFVGIVRCRKSSFEQPIHIAEL